MPFIQLNNNWSDLAQYYNQNFNNKPEIPAIRYTSFDDGLIRGGVLNATLASVRDTARIGKFFASGKGILFIAKQVGLQLSNPKLETLTSPILQPTSGQGFINNVANTVANFVNDKSPNQIYNLGLNTLTQIPLTAFGQHIVRQGKLPIFGGGSFEGSTNNIKGYNYERITRVNNLIGSQASSPVQSGGQPASGDQLQTGGLSYSKSGNRLLQHLKTLINVGSNIKTKETPVILSEYNGGGSSTYGIGKTRIVTYPQNHTDLKSSDKSIQLNGFTNGKGYGDIDSVSVKYSSLQNRSQTAYVNPNTSINSSEASGFNIESRLGVSKVGAYNQLNNVNVRKALETLFKTTIKKEVRSVDAINTISIMSSSVFYGENNGKDVSTLPNTLFTYTSGSAYAGVQAAQGKFGRDIIKFRIEFLNNDAQSSKNPNTDVLAFRAYIDDFNDGFSAKWNSYRYMGRGEEFYVYDGFTRDIGVSFTIYAQSPEEMRPIYQKLNYLMSAFTPDYNSLNKMRGNIAYLTVGDYLYRQPGVFTDMKLSGMLDTHWEIAYDDNIPNDSPQYELPKHIKVSLSFKPIHTFLPRKVRPGQYADTPFVTVDQRAYPAQAGPGRKNKFLK